MTTRIERRFAGRVLPGYELVNAYVILRSLLGSDVRVDDLTFETVVTLSRDVFESEGVFPRHEIVDRQVLSLGDTTRISLFLGLYEILIRRVEFDED